MGNTGMAEILAERDRYMAEASERQQQIGRLEGERDALAAQCAAIAEEAGVNSNDIPGAAADLLAQRDALAAQVAALVMELRKDAHFQCLSCDADHVFPADESALSVVIDPPAAAAVYLAAMRVAEACAVANDHLRSSGDRQRAYDDGMEALADWRKAAGR